MLGILFYPKFNNLFSFCEFEIYAVDRTVTVSEPVYGLGDGLDDLMKYLVAVWIWI